jgi:CubicO group peptidase (beta-lactamase class C family)
VTAGMAASSTGPSPTARAADTLLPVSSAQQGFTPAQATELAERFSFGEMMTGGDVSLFVFLNFGVAYPSVDVARGGPVAALQEASDPRIGETRVAVAVGELSLSDYLVHPQSRAQAMIVIHRGRVAFEAYPGMREFDDHVWMSVSKTTVSLLIWLLADEGKIDVETPIDTYVTRLRGTDWAGTRVQDLLDMASGMDIVENQETRDDPQSTIARFSAAALGLPNADGVLERQLDVIASARRARPAGEAFEYSSCNTVLLVLAAEALTNRRWHDLLRERVWSKLTVEGDMRVAVSPDGIAQAYGYLNARLRDLARYGMLYTPNWPSVAREQIVPDDYIRRIQAGGRSEIYLRGEYGHRVTTAWFPKDPPSSNTWQWDSIWPDGDMHKAGVLGQGLYVSPAEDLVIAYFSTALANDLTQYARQIATDLRARGDR